MQRQDEPERADFERFGVFSVVLLDNFTVQFETE